MDQLNPSLVDSYIRTPELRPALDELFASSVYAAAQGDKELANACVGLAAEFLERRFLNPTSPMPRVLEGLIPNILRAAVSGEKPAKALKRMCDAAGKAGRSKATRRAGLIAWYYPRVREGVEVSLSRVAAQNAYREALAGSTRREAPLLTTEEAEHIVGLELGCSAANVNRVIDAWEQSARREKKSGN